MKKFILQISLFIVFTILVMQVLGYFLDSHFSDFNNKYLDHRANWALGKENESDDFLILGSSRAVNVLDVLTIEEETNSTGINIAVGGTGLAAGYLMLDQYWRRGNRFNTLILHLDYSDLHSDSVYTYPFADYAFLPLLNDDTVSEIYYDAVPKWKYYFWKVAPFMKYAEFNERYPFVKTIEHYGEEYVNAKLDSMKGSQLLWDGDYENFHELKETTIDPEPHWLDQKYLYKIIAFCRRNGVQLYTYTAPYYKSLYSYHDFDVQAEYLRNLANKEGFIYVDFGHDPINKDIKNFRDYTHLTGDAAITFSRTVAQNLKALNVLE